jgi:flagellar protein FliS
MKKEAIRDFTVRVTQASPSELTVILYEMILTEIKEAKEAYEEGSDSL